MTASAKHQPTPKVVSDAAHSLHRQKNTHLVYSPFNASEVAGYNGEPYWHCVEDRIEFANLEARNHCTAFAVFQQLTPLSTTDALFDAAYELWRNEIGHPDSASGRLLGFASHNVNVLMEAAQAIRSKQHQASEVFQVLHLMEVALPHLSNVSAEALIAVVDAQHEATKRDMAVGRLFNAIERHLRSEQQLAWDIWQIVSGNMSESTQNLYSIALQALMHTGQQSLALEKARQDVEDINPLTAGAAIWTLGRAIQAHHLNSDDLDKCIAVLMNKTSVALSEIQQTAIRAVAHASLKDERLMSELVRLAAKHDDYTLAVIADFLFMNHQNLPVSSLHFKTLLRSLVRLSPSQKGAIDNFDWVLCQLYATPEHRPDVLDCLTNWIIQHGGSSLNDKAEIELFDQTIMQIANDKPGFQAVITRWLLTFS